MSGKYTWKVALTALLLSWVVVNLIPLRDTPFETYARQEARPAPELQEKFEATMAKAKDRLESKGAPSFFVALKQVALEDAVRLSDFYPHIELEQSLVNLQKRNSILLDHLLKQSRGKVQLGLDLRGGVSFILEVGDKPGTQADGRQREEDLAKAIEIIADRVDARGVAEPIIRPIGDNRIEVQLAGLNTRDDPEVVDELKKPARLEFRLVHMFQTPDPNRPDEVPPGYEAMTLEEERRGQVIIEELFVKRVPELTGESVDVASVYRNEYGNAQISLSLTSAGGERFADVTRDIHQRALRGEPRGRLAIVLDGRLYSAPTVQNEITGGNATITGTFTDREAFDLVNVLNNPLDVELEVVSMSEVGPTLAQDSVISGRNAFIVGATLTALFMAIFYTLGGVVAVVAMALNVMIILGVMCSGMVGATLSMPGIAGIVLTLGMSVDSNILIFERMREELATGKNLRAALEAGFEKAFSAIFDANLTTLITATIMIWIGSGAVKGFGVTLTIGVFSTMFAALVVTRLLLELLVFGGGLKRIKFFSFPLPTKIDYMRYARPAFIASWVIVLIGMVVVVLKGDRIYGIDFTGGDEVVLSFNADQKLTDAQIIAAATAAEVREILPVYQTPIGASIETLKIQTPFDTGEKVVAKLKELYPAAEFDVVSENRIGGSVSRQLQWNAFLAIGLSLVGILVYVAFRFEIGYGVGAVVAVVHDLLMTIGIFVLFDRQFNAAMVGAILLIAGYSINDTIVVFDRIREELTLNPGGKLRDVINRSLNITLVRTVNTGASTLLTCLALVFIAGGVINDIAFTLTIGIIVGTFSSIFIASPIFFWWHKGDRKHVEESHDLVPKYDWSASSRAAE